MALRLWRSGMILLLLLGGWVSISAQQGEPAVQEIRGTLTEEIAFYDLFGLQAGDVLYIYLQSNDFDPLLVVGNLDFSEEFARDDDSGGGLNAAIKFVVPADGDYSVAITDCCDDVRGDYRLLLGYNEPDILVGDAPSTGAEIAVFFEGEDGGTSTASSDENPVQEVFGGVSEETEFVFYDLFGAEAGQTLYFYAESDEFDTMIVLGDLDFTEEFARDDDGGGGTNSALEFTIPEDGDYSIAITDCCASDAEGEFRLLIGIDEPAVLTGEAEPNGGQIVVAFAGQDALAGTADRTEITDCSELQERPQLSGTMQTRETENFVIHYTMEGVDGTTETFVDAVQQTLEQMLALQTTELGFPLPPRDCGEGGDDRFDVYLEEVLDEGYMGYATPGGLVGDNPNTPKGETWAAYSYLVIDNDFNGYSPPLSGMRNTVTHEFNHVIQFGYDLADPEGWIYEATATWIETVTYPEDEGATPYVIDLFTVPDLCLGSTPFEESTRIYAEWLLIDSIARDHGRESILQLWENAADVEGMDVFYQFAELLGTTPQELVRRFAIRNLLLDYDLADAFGARVRIEANINSVGEVTPRKSGVEELGVDYLLVTQQDLYTFTVQQPNIAITVVGIDQAAGRADVFNLGGQGTVDTTPYNYAYVLLLNTDQHSDTESCTPTDWTLNVSSGEGAPLTNVENEIYDISRFIPAG